MFSSCFQIIHGFSVSKEGWETGCLTGDAPGSVLLDCKERDFCTGAVAEALLQQLWLLSMEVLVPSLGTCIVQHLSFASRGDFGCYMCACTCTRAKLDLSMTDLEQGLPPAARTLCASCMWHCGWPCKVAPATGQGPAGDCICHSGCLVKQMRV